METEIQYVTDNDGNIKNVILPIEYWRRINSDDEIDSNKVNSTNLLDYIGLWSDYQIDKDELRKSAWKQT